MIIEFVGESGCGKSTLAKTVFPNIDGARRKGSLSTKDNIKALFRILSKKSTRKIFFAYFSMEIGDNGLARLFRNTLYVAGLINIFLIEKEKREVWIIDQGLIQFLQTVYFHKPVNKKRYVKIIAMILKECDYSLVACRCDYDVLCERIRMRKNNQKAVERRIENADRGLFDLHENNLKKILKQIPKEQYIVVDTAADSEQNIKEVCNFIESRRRNS